MATLFKACSIEGCNDNSLGDDRGKKGFCSAHYQRYLRYGDGMNLSPKKKPPNGSRMKFIKEVAVPFIGDECLVWPYVRDQQGYAGMHIDGKSITASRLVCTIVHGDPPSPKHQAAHSCGKGHEGCVNPMHLSWKTVAGNMADKLIHGTHLRGHKVHGSKLTESQIISIRLLKGQKSQSKIAAIYGISQPMVSAIHNGTKWSWVTGTS